MKTIILAFYILTGQVQTDRHPNGDKVYHIPSIEVKEAYKEEVLEWIETGVFTYDETNEPKVEQ